MFESIACERCLSKQYIRVDAATMRPDQQHCDDCPRPGARCDGKNKTYEGNHWHNPSLLNPTTSTTMYTCVNAGCPDAGATVMDPASEFYDLMQSDEFGYELEDLSSTMPEVRQVIRDVGPQDAAVYGRGQMRVVRMIRRRRRRCKITSKL